MAPPTAHGRNGKVSNGPLQVGPDGASSHMTATAACRGRCALRSAMSMNLRRSEDEKVRASRLHHVGEALVIAQRVQLGQPSPSVSCLRRALGHPIKHGSCLCVMIWVMRFEGLAPCTKRRPFCERRALALPDASSRRRLVRRFAKRFMRWYLPRSSASRDSIQVFTGT